MRWAWRMCPPPRSRPGAIGVTQSTVGSCTWRWCAPGVRWSLNRLQRSMDLRRFFHLIKRGALVLIVSTVLGAAIGYVVTPRTHMYRATALIYVGPDRLA